MRDRIIFIMAAGAATGVVVSLVFGGIFFILMNVFNVEFFSQVNKSTSKTTLAIIFILSFLGGALSKWRHY